jgi:hypothetical protein
MSIGFYVKQFHNKHFLNWVEKRGVHLTSYCTGHEMDFFEDLDFPLLESDNKGVQRAKVTELYIYRPYNLFGNTLHPTKLTDFKISSTINMCRRLKELHLNCFQFLTDSVIINIDPEILRPLTNLRISHVSNQITTEAVNYLTNNCKKLTQFVFDTSSNMILDTCVQSIRVLPNNFNELLECNKQTLHTIRIICNGSAHGLLEIVSMCTNLSKLHISATCQDGGVTFSAVGCTIQKCRHLTECLIECEHFFKSISFNCDKGGRSLQITGNPNEIMNDTDLTGFLLVVRNLTSVKLLKIPNLKNATLDEIRIHNPQMRSLMILHCGMAYTHTPLLAMAMKPNMRLIVLSKCNYNVCKTSLAATLCHNTKCLLHVKLLCSHNLFGFYKQHINILKENIDFKDYKWLSSEAIVDDNFSKDATLVNLEW